MPSIEHATWQHGKMQGTWQHGNHVWGLLACVNASHVSGNAPVRLLLLTSKASNCSTAMPSATCMHYQLYTMQCKTMHMSAPHVDANIQSPLMLFASGTPLCNVNGA